MWKHSEFHLIITKAIQMKSLNRFQPFPPRLFAAGISASCGAVRACMCVDARVLQHGGFEPGPLLLQHRSRGLHFSAQFQIPLKRFEDIYRTTCTCDIDHNAMRGELLPYGPRTRARSGAPTKEPSFGSAEPGRSKTRNQRVERNTRLRSRSVDFQLLFNAFRWRRGYMQTSSLARPGPARPAPSGHARTARGQRAEAGGTKKTLSYPQSKTG